MATDRDLNTRNLFISLTSDPIKRKAQGAVQSGWNGAAPECCASDLVDGVKQGLIARVSTRPSQFSFVSDMARRPELDK
jgi:hypothetical protein